ncbi:hypothetical protein [Ornithobacterium rhinotracheale]|uniref:hypothetical protein n=3 Tax=Ornithobacterium rhinotracheale TaxID=28251 RepID=UPI004036AC45
MRKYNILLYLAFSSLVFFNSCQDEFNESKFSTKISETNTEIIFEQGDGRPEILKRDLHEPAPTSNIFAKTRGANTDDSSYVIDDESFYYKPLGCSYDYLVDEIDLNYGVKAQVLNLRTLSKDNSMEGVIQTKNLGSRSAFINTYNSYEKEENTSNKIKNFNTGFKIDLKLFKFGFGSEWKRTFNEYIKDIDSAYLGRIDVEYAQGDIYLQLEQASKSSLIERHLTNQFKRGMYTMSMGEFSKMYAPFVLSGYRSGAKLSALIATRRGIYKKTSDASSNFKNILELSFFWKGKNKDSDDKSGNLNLEGGDNIENSYINFEYKDTFYSRILTVGGSPKYSINLPTNKAEKNTIDFSDWYNSLNEKGSQRITKILDEGLIPTSEFIVEENLRRRFSDIHRGILSPNMTEQNPRLVIAKIFVREASNGEILSDVACVLETRNGDNIILTPIRYDASDEELRKYNSESEFIKKGKELSAMFKPFFKGLKIKGSTKRVIRPYLRDELSIEFPFKFKETDNLYKFLNKTNNTWYIYNTENKQAFAYYDIAGVIPGSSGIDELYGCSEWINQLPERPISIYELIKKYKVIGL